MDARAVAKKYNEILANKKYMNKLFNGSFSFDDSLNVLACVMETIICSNGQSPQYTIRTPYEVCRFLYNLGLTNKKIAENIMTNPILCHAFNGTNLEKVLKYGLGSDDIVDSNIAHKLKLVEAKLGPMHYYYDYQLNSRNELYVGFPGFSEMEFATKFSPERLFLGILYQKKDNCLPMIMGETKKSYYTRVLDKNINQLSSVEDKDMLRRFGREIVDRFCSKRPILALFDSYSKDYNLVARDFEKCRDLPIEEYFKQQLMYYPLGNPIDVFSRFQCGKNIFELDDIAVCDNIIPARNLGLIELPDGYEIKQCLAHINGIKQGERVDFLSGKTVDENGNLVSRQKNIDKIFFGEDGAPDVQEFFKASKLVESEFERLSKKKKLKSNLAKTIEVGENRQIDVIDLDIIRPIQNSAKNGNTALKSDENAKQTDNFEQKTYNVVDKLKSQFKPADWGKELASLFS